MEKKSEYQVSLTQDNVHGIREWAKEDILGHWVLS